MVYICGCLPARIPHALAELPETLDETYQRTLQEINKADWEFAHRLFQFVAVASRPLRAEELAELLAFDFKAGPIPKFCEGWRLEDPVDAVLSTCPSLLAIVDGGYFLGKVIQFSHFSVKEFLTSTRISESRDIIIRRYHVPTTPAHTLAAQACLGILLHVDKDVVTGRDDLEKFPLAEYAGKYWADHALFENVSQNVEDGLKQLFDPRKPHLAVCIWIYDPHRQNRRAERPHPPLRTSLHYAALWGLHFIVEFLVIECSQNVWSPEFSHQMTPLHLASARGHVKTACMLIKHGARITARNDDRATPLHLSSQGGQVEVTLMLIEHSADMAAKNKDGETPLHLASRSGQVEVALRLIEHNADMAAKNKDGETPLHLASFLGQGEVARMLIERGADVAAQNKNGVTPLHLASQSGEVEVAQMLSERGANMAAQNNNGVTPLHLASRNGHVGVIRLLIERGAGLLAQIKDGSGRTPLHVVLQKGKAEVARMLIECGADVTAKNKDGETPLHLVSQGGTAEVARMLIERGADSDVAAQNRDGETPLHLASRTREVEVAHMLIECGADVAAQNRDGETPLHLASRTGQAGVVRMLIERGSNVAAQNKDEETPLHLASKPALLDFNLPRLSEVSRILLEQGADVNAQNKAGLTPLRLASQSRHGKDTRAQVLLQHGADPGDGTREDFS